ncbi:MAG: phosphatidate cytidylyltransferase [Lachnospiraceae bacterium]|nr:phosphatidate cytidylyltransferase [Lachnospiraceae bacterium]
MFKTRFISGAVLVVLAIAILYVGGYLTGATMLLLSVGGAMELLRVYKLHRSAMGLLAYIFTVAYYALICFSKSEYILLLMVLYLLAILTVYVVTYPKFKDSDAMVTFVSFFYVSVMLSYVYQIREIKYGGAFVVLIFICSWINDTCAYCVGVKLGKHKMTPKLSPKKSVEGLIGGLFGAALVGACYGIFFNAKVYDINNCPLIFAIVCVLGAGMAVVGDLTASAIKRNNDIKDYGKLIPGHGGILDRFDSMIFTAPVIYYGLYYLIPYFA